MASGGSTGYWTVEAMRAAEVQAAVAKAVTAEREGIIALAIRTRATCYGDGGGHSFADLLRAGAAGTGPSDGH
jgi:ribosomal protein S5